MQNCIHWQLTYAGLPAQIATSRVIIVDDPTLQVSLIL